MSLIIEPSDLLTFQRPLTVVTREVLLVKNPNAEPAIFKVKTTAPKQYCVRPNAGRIEGNGQVEVQVILQPFEDEPPLDYRCKDKFLVQSALVHSHEYDSIPITDLWSRIETQDQGSIRQHKIKCSFVSAPVQDTPTSDNDTSKPEPQSSSQALESDRSDSVHDVNASQGTTEYNPSASNSTSDTLGSTTLPKEDLATKAVTDDLVTAETTKDQPPAVINTTGPSNLEQQEQQPAAAPQHSQTEAEKESQTTTPVTAAPATTSILKDATTPSSPSPVSAEDHPTTRSVNAADPNVNVPSVNVPTKQEAPVVTLHQEEKPSRADEDEKRQLRQALDAAQQKITLLQRELEHSKLETDGLRLRQTASGADSRKLPPNVQPSDAVHQHLAQLQKPHPVEGYPPQVVAIMCGVIFIFTYLFF